MTSGTMQMSGLMAGAARPGPCAASLASAGIPAPIRAQKWLDGTYVVLATPVFSTDRHLPRPLERSP